MSDDPLDIPADASVPILRSADEYELVEPPRPRLHATYWICLALGFVAWLAMFFLPGLAPTFALAGLQSLPFLLLAIFAYLGESRPEWRPLSFAYWGMLMLVVAAGIFLFSAAALMDKNWLNDTNRASGEPMFDPGGPLAVAELTVAFIGIGILSLCLYLPNVRRWLSGLLPIYSGSYVHAVALATVIPLCALLLTPLVILGAPPALTVVAKLADNPRLQDLANPDHFFDQYFSTLATLVWLVPCAVLAVGFPFVRTIRESLVRVGLVRPTVAQVIFALVAAAALAGGMFYVDAGIQWLWKLLGWPTTDAKVFGELMKFAINPIGAVVIGVTAGLGEELFARGVLQPRVGIVLSNLLFTAMHAPQYNWDALVSVFLIGLILGVIRKKSNTTTSAIVHGTYDFMLLYATYREWI